MQKLQLYIETINLFNELDDNDFRLDYNNLSKEDIANICQDMVELCHDHDYQNENPDMYDAQVSYLIEVCNELNLYVTTKYCD